MEHTSVGGPSTRILRLLAAAGLFLVCLAAVGTLASSDMRKSLSEGAPRDDVPFLGITYISLSHEIAVRHGVEAESGLLLTEVAAGSPATAAKLRRGDVIVGLDGVSVAGGNSMVALVAGKSPGDSVVLQVQRGREVFTTELVLGTRSRL